MWVYLSRHRLYGVLNKFSELGQNLLEKVAFDVHAVQVLLELGVGKLNSS